MTASQQGALPHGDGADCLFCRIVAGDLPADIVHTTSTTVAFRDINPIAPVHVLVVPRRHIVNASTVEAADAQDVVDVMTSAREVAQAEGIGGSDRGYRVVFNVGPDALNSIHHLHAHVIGGRGLTWPPG